MKKAIHFTVISSSILLLFLLSTDPQNLPSIFLVVPFVLLFSTILALMLLLARSSGLLGHKPLKAAVVTAAIPVLLLVLQSLGQLTIRDVLALLAIAVVAYLYMSRAGVRSTNA